MEEDSKRASAAELIMYGIAGAGKAQELIADKKSTKENDKTAKLRDHWTKGVFENISGSSPARRR